MATPVPDAYSVASGQAIYGGREPPVEFDSVSVLSEDSGVPFTNANQTMLVYLHGSGGQNPVVGRQYRAACSGSMAYEAYNEFQFYTGRVSTTRFDLRPQDLYGTYPVGGLKRESMWLGFKDMPTPKVRLITLRRLRAMMKWALANITIANHKKTCLAGNSMGGWGTMTFGPRHPEWFAAIYPNQPKWRSGSTVGSVMVADFDNGTSNVPFASAPLLTPEDGGTSVATFMDMIAYVSNTANKIPWIGWNIGRNDGYANWPDQIAAVAALRGAKRGFAFYWNDGDHTVGSKPQPITDSYPYGTFEIGKGYPLFTEHSGDGDPSVDLEGGINQGLSFRNVVETAGTWTCEVTSILGARTVKVEPICSDVFTATVAPKLVTIPAANTWVAVSFTA